MAEKTKLGPAMILKKFFEKDGAKIALSEMGPFLKSLTKEEKKQFSLDACKVLDDVDLDEAKLEQ